MGRRKKRKQMLDLLQGRAECRSSALGHELDMWTVPTGSKSRMATSHCVQCGGKVKVVLGQPHPFIEGQTLASKCKMPAEPPVLIRSNKILQHSGRVM